MFNYKILSGMLSIKFQETHSKNTLLDIIEANQYQNVRDFEWLFGNLKLFVLQCPPSCEKRLANIIQDITIRIEDIREDSCNMALDLIHKHYSDLFFVKDEAYPGHIISSLLYIIGEFASPKQIEENILMLLDRSIIPENKKLHEKAKISLLVTICKLFFKHAKDRTKEEIAGLLSKLSDILEWYQDEIADSLEIYEMLNFYYGIVKHFAEFEYDSLIKLMNLGFEEELLPVHPKAQSGVQPEATLLIGEKMKIDQQEFDILKENQMVKLLIEVEKMSTSDSRKPEIKKISNEEEKKSVVSPKKVQVKSDVMPPGISEEPKVELEQAAEANSPEKGKRKVKVKRKIVSSPVSSQLS